MTYFALVENGSVNTVIVADQNFVNDLPNADGWVQTSFDTRAGQHSKGGTPLRKNYAGIGYAFDQERDAFIPPKPFNSWLLNEDTADWKAPIERPEGDVQWDEKIQTWKGRAVERK